MKSLVEINKSFQYSILNGVKIPHKISFPVIHKENNKYYLAVFLFFFTENDINNSNIDRPSFWSIADFESGEILETFDCSKKDFSSAKYNKKYSIISDIKYETTPQYYIDAFKILENVRENFIENNIIDKVEYDKYLYKIISNVPENYRRFYTELSI